jgi:hypothetical protein
MARVCSMKNGKVLGRSGNRPLAMGKAWASSSASSPNCPVGAAFISGIEDDIAPGGVVKLSEVLAVGIVNDGGVASLLDLVEDGADQSGFAGTGVARNLNVVSLFGAINHQVTSAPALQ